MLEPLSPAFGFGAASKSALWGMAKSIAVENASKGITINSINFLSVNADDGLIRIDIEAERGIIQSLRNSIITIDETDPTAIVNTLEQINR